MKQFKSFIKNFISSTPKNAFYAVVKCADCGEEVKIRINRSSDFQLEYNTQNPKLCYTINKEIIGQNCFNLMRLTLALTKNVKVLYVDTKSCKFLDFYRE